MLSLKLGQEPLNVLCLGAHSDDIEIGVGATLLTWIAAGVPLNVHWCVLSAAGSRRQEALASAQTFLLGAKHREVEVQEFQDGYLGYRGADVKDWFESLKCRTSPDLILTHSRHDAHQDHREVCQLTWNSFRDHLILEYEIPKWDGDLSPVNTFVPITEVALERKIELLLLHFGTQRSKSWFDARTFRGLARLRGMECRAPEGYAEGFRARKCLISPR
jgi:LmbE family N-acetylglucosaminyl deacetylase